VVETARLNPDRPLVAAEESWVVATDLAEALARSGTPFHQAHQMVGKFVLESVRGGKKPSDWTAEEMRAFGIPFPELLSPREGMKSREIAGGTGPESVARALAAAKQRLNEMLA
jgi:argininosuccinate lyase